MKRKWFVAITLSLFLMPIITIAVLRALGTFQVSELPTMSTLPDFSFLDRSGHVLRPSDLSGKVWIGSFIFTSCSGQCPIIVQRLKRVQHDLRYRTQMRYVSFSVDPERDTPEILDRYAKKAEANPLVWYFVTGKRSEMEAVVRDGFKLTLKESTLQTEPITHSSKLVLVDPWSRIRGYYDANDDAEMKKLVKDARRLIKQAF